MKIYCATTNRGKFREFQRAFEQWGGGALELAELPCVWEVPPPAETGRHFEENAIQKALYYSAHAPRLLFAEDSGIEVDALGGEPGVRSARFAGEGATDARNNELLLERLRNAKDRGARYVCVAALAERNRIVEVFRGVVEGEIAEAPRGDGGFGYDPVFYYPPFGRTFGEISAEEKMSVSHRGRALAAMIGYLSTRGLGE